MSTETVAANQCPRCAELERRLIAMTERVLALELEVRELRARLAKDSSNSSKPPSSDPIWKRPPPLPPTGRRPGGQPGHPGHHRQRIPANQVQHLKRYVPAHCEKCHQPLPQERAPDDPQPRWHQTAELVARPVEVTEHQAHGRHCPACGHLNWAAFPAGLTDHILDERLSATLAYLVGHLHLSRRQVEEVMEEVLQVPVGLGTVSAYEGEMSAALEQPYGEALVAAQEAPVKNVDETGWKKKRLLLWLWVAATAKLAVFRVYPERNRRGLHAFLGAVIKGVLGSDRLHAYTQQAKDCWQVCWAHLLRDFQALVDRGGPGAVLGQAGLDAGTELFTHWHGFREGRLDRAALPAALEPVKARLLQALSDARAGPDKKAARFATRLVNIYQSLWTFASCEGVEPTNNHAERMLRPGVIWRKHSFGNSSDEGCRFTERMLTAVQTLRLQQRNVLDYLTQAVRAHRRGLPVPSFVRAG